MEILLVFRNMFVYNVKVKEKFACILQLCPFSACLHPYLVFGGKSKSMGLTDISVSVAQPG